MNNDLNLNIEMCIFSFQILKMGGFLTMLLLGACVMSAHRSFVDPAALPQSQSDHGKKNIYIYNILNIP